jgi:FtsZ-binding cell division protein ZapB
MQVMTLNEKAAANIQRGESQHAFNLLVRAQKMITQIKEFWQESKSLLGDIYDHFLACKAMTTTLNNLGVYYKQ